MGRVVTSGPDKVRMCCMRDSPGLGRASHAGKIEETRAMESVYRERNRYQLLIIEWSQN